MVYRKYASRGTNKKEPVKKIPKDLLNTQEKDFVSKEPEMGPKKENQKTTGEALDKTSHEADNIFGQGNTDKKDNNKKKIAYSDFIAHHIGSLRFSISDCFYIKRNLLPDEDILNNYLVNNLVKNTSKYIELDKTLGDTLLKNSKNACSKATENWDYLPESWLTTEYLNSIGINIDNLNELIIGADGSIKLRNDIAFAKYLKIVDKDKQVIGYAFTKNATIKDVKEGLEHFLKKQLEGWYEGDNDPHSLKFKYDGQGRLDAENFAENISLASEEACLYVKLKERIEV